MDLSRTQTEETGARMKSRDFLRQSDSLASHFLSAELIYLLARLFAQHLSSDFGLSKSLPLNAENVNEDVYQVRCGCVEIKGVSFFLRQVAVRRVSFDNAVLVVAAISRFVSDVSGCCAAEVW